MKQPLFPGLLGLILLVAVHATQHDGGTMAAGFTPEAGGGFQPLITTSELVVGQNRFAFGLLKAHKLIEEANVVVRLYAIKGQEAHLTVELQAHYHALKANEQGHFVHRHPDGTRHVHHDETDVRGLYVMQVTFARPGPWGLEVLARQEDGSVEMARLTVTVLEAPRTPALGSPAPRGRNLIASDVQNLRQIDTSEPPDPRLHQVRVADAIAQGKPQVIVFATPQFCTTRMCGPVVEIVRTLLPVYGDRVVFTHQEIWQDFAAQQLFRTVEEWHLPSEPWIFVVDGQGIIHAKFEGLVTVRELETVLQQMLTQGPARRQ